MENKNKTENAYLGGGCFWCLEAIFSSTKGVKSVESGYAGGVTENPTYEKVCMGATGHAEIVKVEFSPEEISYEILLNIFFSMHDPTTPNKQGCDTGSQYRSIILYENATQEKTAKKIVKKLEEDSVFGAPIVTEVAPLTKFYPAEEYHKDYFMKNPEKVYCHAVISPKVSKFREKFSQYYRKIE